MQLCRRLRLKNGTATLGMGTSPPRKKPLCVLLHFAIFFEVAGGRRGWANGIFTFFQGNDQKKDWKKAKKRFSSVLKKVISKPAYKAIYETTARSNIASTTGADRQGAHSTRKFGKTCARRRGKVSKDTTHIRGRWKTDNNKATSRYENTFMPFPDAECTCELTFDHPIDYELAPNSGLCMEFIVREVTLGFVKLILSFS
jgi:hypothetical protein